MLNNSHVLPRFTHLSITSDEIPADLLVLSKPDVCRKQIDLVV